MEVYQHISVNMDSVLQANTFVDSFLNIFSDDLEYCEEEMHCALNIFRKKGGMLNLEEFRFSIADSCVEEYIQVFLISAMMVPTANFTACTMTSGDIDSETHYVYSDGCLKIRHLYAPDGFSPRYCSQCGAELKDGLYLPDCLANKQKETCTNCGSPAILPNQYTLTEEKLMLSHYTICNEDKQHTACTLIELKEEQ